MNQQLQFHCNTSALWWIERTPTYKDTHIPWQGDRQKRQTNIFISEVTDPLWQIQGTNGHILRQSDRHFMAKRQTHTLTAKRQTHTFHYKKIPFFTARRQTKLFYYTDACTHFVAKRQTKLVYYTDTNAYILWQRDRQNYFTNTDKRTHFAAKRQNDFTTQTQTHAFCSKETDTLSWVEGPLGVRDDGQSPGEQVHHTPKPWALWTAAAFSLGWTFTLHNLCTVYDCSLLHRSWHKSTSARQHSYRTSRVPAMLTRPSTEIWRNRE